MWSGSRMTSSGVSRSRRTRCSLQDSPSPEELEPPFSDVVEPEFLAGFLHEIHQLLDVDRCDRRGVGEVPVHDADEGSPASGHFRALRPVRLLRRGRRTFGREEEDVDIGEFAERPLDQRLHVAPLKPAVPAPERGDRDASDAKLLDHPHQIRESGLNVLDPRF